MSARNLPLPPNSQGETPQRPVDEVEQLKLANHYLRVALDQVREGVIMLDAGPLDGSGPRVLFSNVPVAIQVGVEPDKGLRGLHLNDLLASERDSVALLGALKDAAESGAAECRAQLQTFYSRGSQSCIWRVKALHNSMKRLMNFTITVQPVANEFSTEPLKLNGVTPPMEDLDAQAERLRVENLAAMAQGIAHDVNNLLGPITAQLSLVIPQMEKNSELAQTLDVVLAAVRRAKQFTTQIVKAAKAKPAERQPTDMAEIIRESVRLPSAGSNVQVRMRLPTDLRPALVEHIKMAQVLQNLVLNGMQAMPHGGYMDVEARNIDLRLGQDPGLRPGPYLEIIVRDRGVGISPANMERLFKESFTTKIDGNGIGLTTCKRFVEDQQGAIRVESTEKVGTEFRVYLPAVVEAEGKSEKSKLPKKHSSGNELKQGTGTVLLVDDEIHIRQVAAAILQRCGYKVFECSDGEAAVKTYQHVSRSGRPFDLVLMDLTLRGGMEGLEASREIWKFDPGARIIVSSGSVTDDVQATFLDQGFFDILPKPYEASELSEAVYQAIMVNVALVAA
jgi:signal transduction histidine kinase/ActR/RegA family two-component response regulator